MINTYDNLEYDNLLDKKEYEDLIDDLERWSKMEQERNEAYKAFAVWVAREVFSDDWDKNAFDELTCRKLAKLGIVEKKDGNWVFNDSEVEE